VIYGEVIRLGREEKEIDEFFFGKKEMNEKEGVGQEEVRIVERLHIIGLSTHIRNNILFLNQLVPCLNSLLPLSPTSSPSFRIAFDGHDGSKSGCFGNGSSRNHACLNASSADILFSGL